MKCKLSLLIFIFFTTSIHAQTVFEWQKQIGGSGQDWISSVIQSSDGGYIAIGYSNSNNGDASGLHGSNPDWADIWVVKIDANGSLDWQKMYGGSGGDAGNKIIQTRDGGYIFVGIAGSIDGDVTSPNGPGKCWVVKINAQGGIEWEKTYAYGDNYYDNAVGNSIYQTEDGGYVVSGIADLPDGSTYYWIFKIDNTGEKDWQYIYGGSKQERGGFLAPSKDKGFVLAGGSWSKDGDISNPHGPGPYADFWLVKTDSLGVLQWEKSLGGTYTDEAYNIISTSDGGYLVAGLSASNDDDVSGHHGTTGSESETWVAKLDFEGNIEWQKSLGGNGYIDEVYYSIVEAIGGGYLLSGRTYSTDGDISGVNHGGVDGWIVKLSDAGLIEWQRLLGGSEGESINALVQVSESEFLAAGWALSHDGDITVPVHPGAFSYYFDFWFAKLNIVTNTNEFQTNGLQIFPNPCTSSIAIRESSSAPIKNVALTNLLGQTMIKHPDFDGETVDLSFLPAGYYLIRVETTEGGVVLGKVLKQ